MSPEHPVDLVKMDEKVKLLLALLANLVFLVNLVHLENLASPVRMENLDVMQFLMKETTDSKKVHRVSLVNPVETVILAKEVYQVFLDFLERMEDLVVSVHLDQKVQLVKMAKMASLVNLDVPVLVADLVKEASLAHKEKMVNPDSLVWRVHQVELDHVATKVKKVKLSSLK